MVIELAQLKIQPGQEEAFKRAYASVEHLLNAAKGHISHELHQGIEDPTQFVTLVLWETLADHVEGFRQSPAYEQFRSVIGPFRAAPVEVTHLRQVVGSPLRAPTEGTPEAGRR
jgi:heme-degrading monooxygenase HmoA